MEFGRNELGEMNTNAFDVARIKAFIYSDDTSTGRF